TQIEASIGGTPLQKVKRRLETVTKSKNQKERGAAMSSLPSEVVALRKQMSTLHTQLSEEMVELNRKSFGGVPNTVTSAQFQDFISNYAEPFMHLREKLLAFEGMKSVLREYY